MIYLTSFTFAFIAERIHDHESTIVDDVAKSFGKLASKWINDPDRDTSRSLDKLTLCMCYAPRTYLFRRKFGSVCDRLKRLIEDQLGKHAQNVEVDVRALNNYELLMQALGVEDPTQEKIKFP
ncbi:hypothetical protein H0H93_003691 [Arthromyces matolae]|nr:hypothetical protein H0H93_003691 [Arthromyces matolae]